MTELKNKMPIGRNGHPSTMASPEKSHDIN